MLHVNVLTAKATIGDPVKNSLGETLGEIKDVLFDNERQEAEYAVLDFEGRKEILIPFADLSFIGEEGYFLIPVSKENLRTCKSTILYQGQNYLICP